MPDSRDEKEKDASLEESEPLSLEELADAWPLLLDEERIELFKELPRADAEEFFFALESRDQAHLLASLPPPEQRSWIRLLPPDDVADLIQEIPPEERDQYLALLDDVTRKEVTALLAYAEDDAGGLMNPRYIRLRPEMSIDEAISYFRRQAYERNQNFHYAYVLDVQQRLLGVVAVRELITSPGSKRVYEIMNTDLVTVPEDMDQEAVSHLFAEHNLVAIPVVDVEGKMKGVVTVDDIVDVVTEEATEDIQKIGGMEALDEPYLTIGFTAMLRKRAGWLSALFLSEMLTTTAMGHFEDEIGKVLALASFVPLIISSGGNSGSQASTLVIRAMALGEVRLRDWWRVIRREFASGLALGSFLGVIGFCRVALWHFIFKDPVSNQPMYGPHYLLIAATIMISLIGVVLWGTLSGSMLPIVLRRLGFDPASSSAPFVATMVDVTGLVIYFTVASMVLRGTLL